MKSIKFCSLLFLAIISNSILSCSNNLEIVNFKDIHRNKTIKGKVEFNQKQFNTKANLLDIAPQATVSLLYPSDHPTMANITIATGLTDSNGIFTISPSLDFTPNQEQIYILEAVKRLGDAGKSLLSVRTFLKYTGSGWESISYPSITINNKTTALTVISSYNSTSVPPSLTLNKLNTTNDIIDNLSPQITSKTVDIVSELVKYSLQNNYDPSQYIKFDGTRYFVDNPVKITPKTVFNTDFGNIITVAGAGREGTKSDGNQASQTILEYVSGMAIDSLGNLFISESLNHRVRKINTNGLVSTIAGSITSGNTGDNGPATSAKLNQPRKMTVDSLNNIYIADTINNKIRKVSINGTITTVVGTGIQGYSGDGGQATNSQLNQPRGVFVDSLNNIYIADTGNNRIRKVDTNGIITTIAGNGTSGFSGDNSLSTLSQLNSPYNVNIDNSSNIYIADTLNHRIRKVDTNGIITTIAGNGTAGFSGDGNNATLASLNSPYDLTLDNSGNIYIADTLNHRIRKVDTNGVIYTIAGNGLPGLSGDYKSPPQSKLFIPGSINLDSNNNMYIADFGSNRIRKIIHYDIVVPPPPNTIPPPTSPPSATFNGTNFTDAILKRVGFSKASFVNATFLRTDMTDSDFSWANFSSSNLLDANLTNTNLRGTNLTGAILDTAIFSNTELSGARWVDGVKICAEGSIDECK